MPLDTCQRQDAKGSRDTLLISREWLDHYPAVAVATVIRTWGSAPVPVGGQLVIAPGDRVEGSVSGGCVEAAVIAEAHGVIATGRPKVLGFGVEDEMAWRVGLPCGGRIEVLIARYQGDGHKSLLDNLLEARRARLQVVVETNLETGALSLHVDGSAFDAVVRASIDAGESLTTAGEGARSFLHVHAPQTQLVIVGAGHIGQIVADLGSRIGYKITVVDPRGVYASIERFEGVHRAGVSVVQEWPETALPGLMLDRRSAVLTLSHAVEIDDEALMIALTSPCFYVGALGSRRSHGERVKRLLAKGITEDQLARLDAPAGLPIGAIGPHEIAVSMLGAVIKAARGKA